MRILSVTTVRNEAPYLLEWIAHHRGAGVTDFLIYSNDCDDGTDRMLSLLADAGEVVHVPHVPNPDKSIQWQALRQAWKHPLRKEADWIMVTDVDEFVNIHIPGQQLSTLIARVGLETDAILLPWRLFGSNDHTAIQDMPVTAQFTKCISAEAQYPVAASLFKTLFRTNGPFNQLGVHRPKQKDPEKARLPKFADGSGNAVHPFLAQNPQRLSLYDLGVARDLVELNHYAVRSAAAFVVKRDRGLPNRATKKVDLAYWVERNFNTEENTSISTMRVGTEAVLLRLLALDGVAEAHEMAVRWHRDRFDQLIKQPEVQELMSQILCAGGSQVPSRDLQRQLVKWYQQANNKNS